MSTGEWRLTPVRPDFWRLDNATGGTARHVVVTFRGAVDGRPWTERVVINPPILPAQGTTEIHIFRSETVTAAEVTWRSGLGRTRSWSTALAPGPQDGSTRAGADRVPAPRQETGFPRTRVAVLRIDDSTALPLLYEYDPATAAFRTIGFVRLGGVMHPQTSHTAPDTDAGRDEFLRGILVALLIPASRAARIVRTADHG